MTLYTYIASQGRKRIPAEDVELDATGFTGNLATTDSNCQLLAEAVDALTLGAATATGVSVDATGFTGNLATTDSNCQLVADAVDALTLGATTATGISVDASGFTGNLTTSDSNCQLVAAAVDSLVISASRALMVYSHPGGAQPSGTNYMSGFTADYTNGSFITINTASGYDKFVIGEAGSYLLTMSLRIAEIGTSSSYIRLYKNGVVILRGTGQYYTGNGGADSICYVYFITGVVNDEYYFDFTEASNAIIQGFQVIFEQL